MGGVDAAIAEISVVAGAGSQARRRDLLGALFAAATADEQRLLIGLFGGELRQGAQAGLLADAIARAAEVPLTAVRRALLLSGDLKQVAVAALTGGAAALAEIHLRVGTPLTPMLAQSAPDVGAALLATGTPATVDVKLDGIRIQVHRSGDEVAVFTRSLDDITARMPEVVAAVRGAAGARGRARRRGDGARRDRPAAAVPGDVEPGRDRRGGAGGWLSRRTSSTCCTSTAPTCSTSRAGCGGPRSPTRCRAELLVGRTHRRPPRRRPRRRSPPRWPPGRRAWWSRPRRRRTTWAGAVRPGSRSNRGTRSTWWSSPSSGVTAGARAGCPTCTSARATRRPAGS